MRKGMDSSMHYVKPEIVSQGNLSEITYGSPAWQFSCGLDSHARPGNGHGYGHCKARGRGHTK